MILGLDMVHGLELLYEFLVTALILRLPWVLLIGGICFAYTKLLLRFKHPVIAAIAKLALGLASLAAIAGLCYGILRWNGVIMFPTDNGISWNWFDCSWRDDGFEYIHLCGCALIGIALAVWAERNARRGLEGTAGAAS